MKESLTKKRVVVRRSESEWKALIGQYGQSGLSQRQFCQRESLGLSTFQKWKKRLEKRLSSSDFIEIPAPAEYFPWDIELDLGFGITLRLRKS